MLGFGPSQSGRSWLLDSDFRVILYLGQVLEILWTLRSGWPRHWSTLFGDQGLDQTPMKGETLLSPALSGPLARYFVQS